MNPNLRRLVLPGVFLIIGLMVNAWTLSWAFLPRDAQEFSTGAKGLIYGIQAFFFANGLFLLFWAKTDSRRRKFKFAYLTLGLTVVVMELILQVLAPAFDLFPSADACDPRISHSAYKDKAWTEDYFKEFNALERRFAPYLSWRRLPFKGQHINIDSHGVRKTWNPEFGPTEKSKLLYVFGGSTTWGSGARDNATIPSFLSKKLHGAGKKFRVINYGESAYIFTQEVIRLTLLLKDGHRPDYVIFYDGVNEIYSAFQSGMPGIQQNVMRIQAKLKAFDLTPGAHISEALQKLIKDYCRIFQMGSALYNWLDPEPRFREWAARYSKEQLQILAGGIMEEYLKTFALLDTLSHAYGFKYLCFWQPALPLENAITPEERTASTYLECEALVSLFHFTYARMKNEKQSDLFDISDVLQKRERAIYTDMCHLAEEGNQMVAERIYRILTSAFLDP